MENKEMVVHDPNVSLNLQKVADGLFKSGMFPNAKNAFGAFAIVEFGHELGIPPMMALKNINIIAGQLACNAQLMLSLAMSRGVTFKVIKESDKGAEIEFKRGDIKYLAIFSEEDAKAAGLAGKDNWKKYARDMYFWRAAAKGIRRIAPDSVLGLYTKDEISNGEIVDINIPVGKAEEAQIIDPDKPKDDVPDFQPIRTQAPEEKTAPMPNLASPAANADVISVAQGQRLFVISNASGIETGQLKLFLKHYYGYEHSNQVKKAKYKEIVDIVSSKEKFDVMMAAISSRAA